MRQPRAKLHLHIGRNKAGSTTLQDHWTRRAGDLRRAGVEYAMFGQPSPPGTDAPTFSTHQALIQFVRERRGGAVLVSHEGICCFTPEVTQALATDLATLDVQLILYVRRYRDWVVSSYAFDVRMGINGRDFDRYLEDIWDTVSFWPMIEIWGETLGWKNIRVRSLDPRDLLGGDLVCDADSAIGVALPSSAPAAKANASPSWMVIEMLRFIAATGAPGGWDRGRQAVAEAMHEYLQAVLEDAGLENHKTEYLRSGRATLLAEAYNRDLSLLAAKGRHRLQSDTYVASGERPFMPVLEVVQRTVLAETRRRALEPRAALLHPEAAAFVQLPAFEDLCGY